MSHRDRSRVTSASTDIDIYSDARFGLGKYPNGTPSDPTPWACLSISSDAALAATLRFEDAATCREFAELIQQAADFFDAQAKQPHAQDRVEVLKRRAAAAQGVAS